MSNQFIFINSDVGRIGRIGWANQKSWASGFIWWSNWPELGVNYFFGMKR